MNLPDLDLPTTIDTSTDDMAARLYEPALAVAPGYGTTNVGKPAHLYDLDF
jgi:hypothetical protein